MALNKIKPYIEKVNTRLSGIFDLFVFVLLGAIDFITIVFGKYLNHKLDFEDFNLMYTGNFLTLLYSATFILLLIVFWLKDKSEFTKRRSLFLVVWFLGFGFTVFGIYLNQSDSGIDINLLDTPFYKLYTGLFFNIGFAFKTAFFCYILIKIIKPKRFLILYTGLAMLILYLSVFVYTYKFIENGVTYKLSYSESSPAEIGVILGAAVWKYNKPSTILKLRIDKGLQLYSQGIVKKLQLTGSNAPGELAEADVAFYYLMEKKVNPADIRIESESRSTLDQISYIKRVLIEKSGFQKIIVISDAFHLPRVKELAEFYNLNIDVVKSDLSLAEDSVLYYNFREVIGLINFWMFGVK